MASIPDAPRRIVSWALSVKRGADAEARRLFFIEGLKACREAAHGQVRLRCAFLSGELATAEGAEDLLASLRARDAEVLSVPARVLSKLAHTGTPQGIVLIAERPVASASLLLRSARALAVYLDAVQDPGNVGAIVRAAHALGAGCVIRGAGTADPFSPKAARASAGSELRIAILDDRDAALLAELARAGFLVLAADPRAPRSLRDVRPPARTVLLLGSEGQGISPPLVALQGEAFHIPLAPGAESLNVAQAAAIALFVLRNS